MPTYTTRLKAIDPLTGQLKNWAGPYINAISWQDAKDQCQVNGLGYCEVDGILERSIEISVNGKKIETDFELPGLN